MVSKERKRLLNEFIRWTRPLKGLGQDLDAIPIDEDTKVTLTRTVLITHLENIIYRRRSQLMLQNWALMIFACDDIPYEDDSDTIAKIIFSIAHPGTRETMPAELIIDWIKQLQSEGITR